MKASAGMQWAIFPQIETLDMIGLYLLQLLDRYPMVVIPGLGTFTSGHRQAELLFAERSILPPSRWIEFQKEEGEAAFQLLPLVVQETQLASDALQAQLSHFVARWQHELETTGSLTIEGFGSLEKDMEGQLRFQYQPGLNLNLDAFGLPVLKAETVFARNHVPNEREVPVIPLHPFDDEIIQVKEEAESTTRPRFRPLAYAAVTAALALAFSGVFVLNRMAQPEMAGSMKVVEKQEAALVPGVGSSKEEKIEAAPVAQAPKPEIPAHLPTEPIPAGPSQYFVIAGSFADPARAQVRREELRDLGFQVSLHENAAVHRTRVAIASFAGKAEALEFLKARQKDFTEQLWILPE